MKTGEGGTVPESIERLEAAHVKLVRAYSAVHGEARRKLALGTLVDSHARRGLRTLGKECTHLAIGAPDSPEQAAWLKEESKRLGEYATTFDRRWLPKFVSSRLFSVWPGIEILFAIVGLSGISGLGVVLSGTCLCQLLVWIPLGLTLVTFAVALFFFDTKRELFVAAGVYEAEDDIYRALGVEKHREPSLWGWALAMLAAIWLLAAVLEVVGEQNQLFENSGARWYWIYVALLSLGSVAAFAHARKRDPA